jgi:hypothetical protein
MRGEAMSMGVRSQVIEEETELFFIHLNGLVQNIVFPRNIPSNTHQLFFLEQWQKGFSGTNSLLKPIPGRARTVVTLRQRKLLKQMQEPTQR